MAEAVPTIGYCLRKVEAALGVGHPRNRAVRRGVMRLFSVTTAVCISLLSTACAVGCWYRAEGLRSEADWLLERSKAQASEYAHSLNDTLATQELETFAKRRAVLERAHVW